MPGIAQNPTARTRPVAKRPEPSVEAMVEGITTGDRAMLGRAITLVESIAPRHRETARDLIHRLLPRTGKALRLGITGVPGVGKSTLVETLGMHLMSRGHRLAVLAVDPSSDVSGGSILGDKTRMENLSQHPNALVRPSPCGGWLGGVARGSREAMLVCEAAGFDVIFIETVGVGQSETQVASMVDTFLLLMLAGAGDELQGIKRGIVELADVLAITKADGDNINHAKRARAEYQGALRLLRPSFEGWITPVLTCSALTGDGIPELWDAITRHRDHQQRTGEWDKKRSQQAIFWFEQTLQYLIRERFHSQPAVRDALPSLRNNVAQGTLTPTAAAEHLVSLW